MSDGVTITFDQASIDAAMRQIEAHLSGKLREVRTLCQKYALIVQGKAKRNLANDPRRIDKGTLRQSIHWRQNEGIEFDVYTALEYAAFVHFGTGLYGTNPAGGHRQTPWVYYDAARKRFVLTRGMKPNPFMLNAINEVKDDFFRDLLALFRDANNG